MLGDTVVGPLSMVFALRESDVVSVDCVVVVGETVIMEAVSVLAVREERGVCAAARQARRRARSDVVWKCIFNQWFAML